MKTKNQVKKKTKLHRGKIMVKDEQSTKGKDKENPTKKQKIYIRGNKK